MIPTLPERISGLHGVRRHVEVPGFNLYEVVHPPHLETLDHAHDYAQFSIIREGEFIELVGGRHWKYEPGAILFWSAGAVHRNLTGDQPARAIVVQTNVGSVHGLEDLFPLGWPPFVIHASALGEVVPRLVDEFDREEILSTVALEGLLLELLARASRLLARTAAPRWLESARRYVEGHFRERIDIGTLARRAGVSRGELTAEFRKRFRATPAAAVRALRFERACRLLREGRGAIADVAIEAGYYDQAHLDREFRKTLDCTPAEYRRHRGSPLRGTSDVDP